MFEIVATFDSLLFSRFHGAVNEDSMAAPIQAVRAVITRNRERGLQTVCVTDVREVQSLTPGAADALVWLMRRDNVAKTVNAFYARAGDVSHGAEFAEIVRQGQSELRRLFTDEKALQSWVAPYLSDSEQARVSPFLSRPIVKVRPRPQAKGAPPVKSAPSKTR